MRLKVLKFLCLSVLLVQNSNCQTRTIEDDQKAIYTLVIDHLVRPFPPPPPPPPNSEFQPMTKRVSDSINSIRLKVAISPYFSFLKKRPTLKNIDTTYHKAVEVLFSEGNDFLITEGLLGSKKGHTLVIVSENELDERKRLFQNFNELISLSRIVFDQNKNRAVVHIGRTLPGKLSGSTALYLLKKQDGEWIIDSYKVISIS